MSETYAAFLRGININGNKISMENLRKIFSDLGYLHVQTVLNTGNIIFSSDQTAPELKAAAEARLKSSFGYQSSLFLRTAAELKSLQDFAKKLPVPTDCHLYLLLCDSSLTVSELDRLFSVSAHVSQESFQPINSDGRDAFWIVPKGQTLSSPFGSKVLGSKKYRDLLTSRNQNTLERILALIKTD